jgi:hypothetical protein
MLFFVADNTQPAGLPPEFTDSAIDSLDLVLSINVSDPVQDRWLIIWEWAIQDLNL